MRVIVGMATTNERRANAIKAMDSLAPYVDEIHLYNNDKESVDYTDNAKFFYIDRYKEPVYWISADDDIIYPEWFVDTCIDKIEQYNSIVTFHGRRLKGTNLNYYREHYLYSLKNLIPRDVKIDIAGTGVSAWRTDQFNAKELYKANDKKMADLVLSLEAKKQGVNIMMIAHDKEDFIVQDIPKELTIFDEMKDKQERLIELANEIYETN